MKLFALGRTVLANSCNIGLAGKVAKFTEKAIIVLRILSSVGLAWRPPGHPGAYVKITAKIEHDRQNSINVLISIGLQLT